MKIAVLHGPNLNLLGTRSGRDTSKMTDCGLTPIALTRIACPGFAEAKLILECRKTYFDDLADVYEIRNIIAHRAGIADLWAAGNVKGMVVTADKPVVLTPQRLIDYAASVIKIAEGLDSKLEGVPEAAAPKIRRKR